MTGGNVCALNLQSQLMGEIEEFGMRRVMGHSPMGQDASWRGSTSSWLSEEGVGATFLPQPLGRWENGSSSLGAGLTRQVLGCPFGCLWESGGPSWSCRSGQVRGLPCCTLSSAPQRLPQGAEGGGGQGGGQSSSPVTPPAPRELQVCFWAGSLVKK